LKLRGVNDTITTAESRTLCYRDGDPIAGAFLERDCRNEEGENGKNESGGEVHFYKQ